MTLRLDFAEDWNGLVLHLAIEAISLADIEYGEEDRNPIVLDQFSEANVCAGCRMSHRVC